MLNEKTLKFIEQLEKTAADSSQGQRQEKYKYKITKKNNTGSGTALGAGLGAFAGALSPKYKSLAAGAGALTGAGIGNLIGRKSVDTSVQKEKQQDIKRVEKKESGAKVPTLSSPSRLIGLDRVK